MYKKTHDKWNPISSHPPKARKGWRPLRPILFAWVLLFAVVVAAEEPNPVTAAIHMIEAGNTRDGMARLDAIIASNKLSNEMLADALHARGEMRRRMRQTDGAIADLTRSIRLKDRVPARAARALANAFVGQFEQPLADWDFVVRNSSDPASALSGRAGLLLKMGRLDAALADANAALGVNPADSDALGYRAFVETSRRQFSQARSDLDRALSLAPDDPSLLLLQAQLLANEGKVARAIAAYDSAITRHPSSSALLSGRIAVLQTAGEYARGQADCKALLTLAPDDSAPFLRVDAPTLCAVLELNFGKYGNAADYFSRAITAASRPVPHLYVFRGLARGLDGKIPGAISDLDQAIITDPRAQNAHLLRAILRKSIGRTAAAVDDLNATIANEPGPLRGLAILWLAQLDHPNADVVARRYLGAMSAAERRVWPWPLIDFFLNGSPPAELDAIIASYDPTVREFTAS